MSKISHQLLSKINQPGLLVMLLPIMTAVACQPPEKPEPAVKKAPASFVRHPEWSRNANIYEVNVRQFTPEGTIKAVEAHIPRLKQMGVDIIWLMPVMPLGVEKHKGVLGSHYCIRDYEAVNPAYGTMEDLRDFVRKAHESGMYVILDWVANHTAWDHPWIKEHPEYYVKDSTGAIKAPYDWIDVAQLDYGRKEVWAAMRESMIFWLSGADVDGFRCDVAWMVPIDFWTYVRHELERVKPVFMLAEAEIPTYHLQAFDASYAWELHHLFKFIYRKEKNANHIEAIYQKQDTSYPADAYRMLFTSNHDENTHQGSEFERLGEAALTFAVLTVTMPGIPMIYNGQESAFTRRLKEFEKDSIDWKDYALAPFYQSLFELKHKTQPLWNGSWGGRMVRIHTAADTTLFCFTREKEGEKILVLTNLSTRVQETLVDDPDLRGSYTEWFTREKKEFGKKETIRLKPWEYKVYIKQ